MRFCKIIDHAVHGQILIVKSPIISDDHFVEITFFNQDSLKFVSTEIECYSDEEAFEILDGMTPERAEKEVNRALFNPDDTHHTVTMSHAGGSLH